jgi:hypothetical protein
MPDPESVRPSGTTCPDCGVELRGIKLIDATERTFGEGSYRVDLAYAAQEAEAPALGWFGGIAPQGKVYGRLCTHCGRIYLHAVPMPG